MTTESNVNEIVLACYDDWQGVYLNGELEMQDHSFDGSEMGDFLNGNQPFTFEAKDVDYDWMDGKGDFPDKLSEIVFQD